MPALYIHVPFCIKKCDYCAFYSVPAANYPNILIKAYLDSLKKEIKLTLKELNKKEPVTTVFIGGGTPSALKEAELELFLKTLSQGFELGAYDEYERTLEGNPGTLTLEKLQLKI